MCAKKVIKTGQIAHPFLKHLIDHSLNLSQQNLTDQDMPEITRFLLDHPNIRSLDLSLNHIGDQGLADFTERNLVIVQVNFEGNNISDKGLAMFAYINHIITEVNFDLYNH